MDAKLVGGRIVSMRPDAPPASAVAVQDGRIVHVGGDADVLAEGLSADLVVLDAQPFEEPGAIKDIPVALTICRGAVIHAEDGAF